MQIAIRPCHTVDISALVEAVRESTVEAFPWQPWCHPGFSERDAVRRVEHQAAAWASGTEFEFCVLDEEGRLLGTCGIKGIHRRQRFASVGYWVRTSMNGLGIATSAVKQVVEFAGTRTDLIRLELVVAVGNIASARVATKAGATFEGVLRSRLYLHGRSHDAFIYSIIIPR